MDDITKKEYIIQMRNWNEEDKKIIFLLIAFDLSIIFVTLSKKIFGTNTHKSPLVFIGIVCLLIGVGLFYTYYHRRHQISKDIIKTLKCLSIDKADNLSEQAWESNKKVFRAAYILSLIGIILFFIEFYIGVKWW